MEHKPGEGGDLSVRRDNVNGGANVSPPNAGEKQQAYQPKSEGRQDKAGRKPKKADRRLLDHDDMGALCFGYKHHPSVDQYE